MQWDGTVGAGFTRGRPWLPIGPTAASDNVAALSVDPRSILALHRSLTALRRRHAALSVGRLEEVRAGDEVLRFLRVHGSGRLLVLLNMGGQTRTVPVASARVLLSTHLDRSNEDATGELVLRPDEGVVLDCNSRDLS